MKKAFEKYKEAGASLAASVDTAWFLDQLLETSTMSSEQSSMEAIDPPNTPPVLAVLARLLLTLAELDEVYGQHVNQG